MQWLWDTTNSWETFCDSCQKHEPVQVWQVKLSYFYIFFKLNNLKHIVHFQRKLFLSSTTANLPPFARKNVYVFSAWGLWFTSQFTADVANKSLDILTEHQVFQMQINSLWEFFFSNCINRPGTQLQARLWLLKNLLCNEKPVRKPLAFQDTIRALSSPW